MVRWFFFKFLCIFIFVFVIEWKKVMVGMIEKKLLRFKRRRDFF